MVTRKSERKFRTLDPKDMLNMYIAEKVVRKWKEDFIDENTNETVTVERCEALYVQGTLIDQNVLARIRFDIEAGDIKEPILVSDQLREAQEWKNTSLKPWQAKAEIGDKTVKLLLYGQSVDNVMEILRDYIELNYKGRFAVTEVKEFTDCIILEDTLSDKMDVDDISIAYLNGEIDMDTYTNAVANTKDEDQPQGKDKKYYQIEYKISWVEEDGLKGEYTSTFVVNTFDTERASVVTKAYLKCQDEKLAERARKDGNTYFRKTFSLLIEKAAPIPVGCFIPLEFSQVYAEE